MMPDRLLTEATITQGKSSVLAFSNLSAPKLSFTGTNGRVLFSIAGDGAITRGPAFTTDDEMSLAFWGRIEAAWPQFLADKPKP